MSDSPHVALVRRFYRLYAEGRFDEWLALFTDDAEAPALALSGSELTYRGSDGVRRWLDELSRSGTVIRAYADEFVEVDERRVVVAGRLAFDQGDGRGYGSVAGWIYTIEGDRIARIETFPHPSQAYEAAGLSWTGAAGADAR
jgi:ketosteroid isomerase-like protein